jgi:3-oxoacyl-[acyl-carrier-protein] synthase-3
MGVAAAEMVMASGACTPDQIDFILFCTETPDYFLPATACLVQHRLGIPVHTGALDFNLGCSGYVYGLGLAKGLIQSGQATRVLLITAEVITKLIAKSDRAARVVFGDAASATIIEAVESDDEIGLGPFLYGTDGRGAQNLIVREGGLRAMSLGQQASASSPVPTLRMDGQKILEFAIRTVPDQVRKLLANAGLDGGDVDLFVFHQASKYVLEMLRHLLKIPEERFCVCLADCGNTVSSTIPIALRRAIDQGQLVPGKRVVLCGYGVGLSWGATIVKWTPMTCLSLSQQSAALHAAKGHP